MNVTEEITKRIREAENANKTPQVIAEEERRKKVAAGEQAIENMKFIAACREQNPFSVKFWNVTKQIRAAMITPEFAKELKDKAIAEEGNAARCAQL